MNTPTIHSYQRCNATTTGTSAWFVYGESGAYPGERQWRPFARVLRDEVESGPAYWVAHPGPAFIAPIPAKAVDALDRCPLVGVGHTREAAIASLIRNQNKEG